MVKKKWSQLETPAVATLNSALFSNVQSQLETIKKNTSSHTLFSVVAATTQKQGLFIALTQGGKRGWEKCFKEDLLVMMIDYFIIPLIHGCEHMII